MSYKKSLLSIYQTLLDLYGYQNWWPIDAEYHRIMGTDPREEIVISAVLTQNTSWKNVEKALENIKKHGVLSLEFIRSSHEKTIQDLIRPAGFYRLKTQRLKEVAVFLNPIDKVRHVKRQELLSVKGIGKETADVILLYAGERMHFVIDKYTQRFMERFYGIKDNYESLKRFFEENLPKDLKIYKEFHALIDEHAKKYCRSSPLCKDCPLKDACISASPSF